MNKIQKLEQSIEKLKAEKEAAKLEPAYTHHAVNRQRAKIKLLSELISTQESQLEKEQG